ncbi:MAG TPA: patatin-like phospholipase family protein [Albitalea sp.]|nr:patatin-like phospholipase family protein [Albitalea sp.]
MFRRSAAPLRVLAAVAALFVSVSALADPVLAAKPRPRVALVLSGGGARGFAHIGVLRVLRDMQVPVDMVLGTSMGGVIGGAYAAGTGIDKLDDLARHTDWDAVVADRPARDALVFRRREEDVLLPSRIELGLHRDGVALPPAAADNAALEQALGRLLPPGTRDTPVNALALPFRSVASDLVTGELVELATTPLFMTMRASLAVPGVFAPVRVNGRLVADGGLVRNLPVDLAHEMGADVVIAVNVGTPLAPEKTLGSAIGVAQQMLNILTEQNVQRSLQELQARDVLVSPNLDGVNFLDFHKVDRAIAAGEKAARALAPRLAALAVTEEEYALYEHSRLAAPALVDPALPLRKVEVLATGSLNPEALERQSGLKEGKPATQAEVRRAAESLYGRGDVARIETDIKDEAGQRDVTIQATESKWASSRLRVGLELASDFDEANSFALKVMHVRSSINPWGAELRTVLRVGDKRDAGVQFWQPLGPGAKWYVAPSVQYGSSASDLFDEGRRLLRRSYNEAGGSVVLGRELGNWGDLQVGANRQRAEVRDQVPQSPGPSQYFYDTTHFMRFRVDTLDSLAFPSRGFWLDASIERSPGTRDAPKSLARSQVSAMAAVHTTNWAGHVYGEWAMAQRGSAPLTLGGFLRLSGTTPDSVEGRGVAFGRMVLARRIGTLPLTIGGTVRAGFSLEAGGAYDGEHPLRADTINKAGSAFLSLDTRFGPAYLGAGATKNGDRTMYLFLGPVW